MGNAASFPRSPRAMARWHALFLCTKNANFQDLSNRSGLPTMALCSSSSSAGDNNNNIASNSTPSVHLVVQRYRTCKLLVDEEEDRWVSMVDNCPGMLVYVSFAATATESSVHAAAETILNLPVLTTGVWGDGSPTRSIRQIMRHCQHGAAASNVDGEAANSCSIAIVPQANLICKVRLSMCVALLWFCHIAAIPFRLIFLLFLYPDRSTTTYYSICVQVKSQGKSIQYHGQIDKSRGQELYDFFVDSIRAGVIVEAHRRCDDDAVSSQLPPDFVAWQTQREQWLMPSSSSSSISPTTTTATSARKNLDPAISETQVFRSDPAYGSFDESTGMPLTMANGTVLTKSAVKKIRKIYDAHAQKHFKYVQQQRSSSAPPTAAPTASSSVDVAVEEEQQRPSLLSSPSPQWSTWMESCNTKKCQVVAGSFGQRQGLAIESDMGPFCHVVTI
jgi:hypothetical protein